MKLPSLQYNLIQTMNLGKSIAYLGRNLNSPTFTFDALLELSINVTMIRRLSTFTWYLDVWLLHLLCNPFHAVYWSSLWGYLSWFMRKSMHWIIKN